MTEVAIYQARIEIVRGNLVEQPDVDVIVNASNPGLRAGSGVAGAIHAAAGPGLAAECKPFAPLRPGEAIITGAHDLPNKFVVHCLGPRYGIDKPEDEVLAGCYRKALVLANDKQASSIAFPAISTGAFGFPIDEAARVAIATIVKEIPGLSSVRLVRFVLFDQKGLDAHEAALLETLPR